MNFNSPWSYYLSLEEDVRGLGRYVEFDKTNFGTFSIEFLKFFQCICTEIEAMFKKIGGGGNISEYKDFILNNPFYKKLIKEEIKVHGSDILLKPFDGWELSKLPWWDVYNKVKHQRNEIDSETKSPIYKSANLENV